MRRRILAVLAAALIAVPTAPGAARADPDYPFRDPHLPLPARVDDLVGRLTLDEKISLLHQYQPAIPRLGIKLFKAGTEALHGVAWSNDIDNNAAVVSANGTTFAQPVGLASTWDTPLIQQVGSAVGDEARGFNAENPRVFGLNLWRRSSTCCATRGGGATRRATRRTRCSRARSPRRTGKGSRVVTRRTSKRRRL